MEVAIVVILFVLGLVLIIKGGDWFVDAASYIAKITGIPSFIIGATIVSFATTLPELLVSVNASLSGSPDIAIGNAIGSTICNIGLISGISLVAMPVAIDKGAFKVKGLIMIVATGIFVFLAKDFVLSQMEAIVLIVILVYYIYYNLTHIKHGDNKEKKLEKTPKDIKINIIKFVVGVVFIIIGADLLVDNGILIATILGVPQNIVALTMIALGTSLPELTTTVSSIIKKDSSLGIGNIIGANILNITMILSISSFTSSKGLIIPTSNFFVFGTEFIGAAQTLIVDIPFALLLMAILVIPTIIKGKLTKIQGIFLLGTYIAYMAVLFSIVL